MKVRASAARRVRTAIRNRRRSSVKMVRKPTWGFRLNRPTAQPCRRKASNHNAPNRSPVWPNMRLRQPAGVMTAKIDGNCLIYGLAAHAKMTALSAFQSR